jgi:hypothetical protein
LFTERFLSYKIFVGFQAHICRPSDPQSKGKIEAVIKFVKINFLKHRTFHGIDSLNHELIEWLDRTGNGLIHGTTKLVPKLVFNEERRHLLPFATLSEKPKQKSYLVRKDNIVVYKSNRYAVPIGTYKPGKQVHMLDDGETVTITEIDGSTITKYQKPRQKGLLLRQTRPERIGY